MHIHTRTHASLHIHICIYVHTCIYKHINMRILTHTNTCLFAHTYMYICTYLYIQTYNIYTNRENIYWECICGSTDLVLSGADGISPPGSFWLISIHELRFYTLNPVRYPQPFPKLVCPHATAQRSCFSQVSEIGLFLKDNIICHGCWLQWTLCALLRFTASIFPIITCEFTMLAKNIISASFWPYHIPYESKASVTGYDGQC